MLIQHKYVKAQYLKRKKFRMVEIFGLPFNQVIMLTVQGSKESIFKKIVITDNKHNGFK